MAFADELKRQIQDKEDAAKNKAALEKEYSDIVEAQLFMHIPAAVKRDVECIKGHLAEQVAKGKITSSTKYFSDVYQMKGMSIQVPSYDPTLVKIKDDVLTKKLKVKYITPDRLLYVRPPYPTIVDTKVGVSIRYDYKHTCSLRFEGYDLTYFKVLDQALKKEGIHIGRVFIKYAEFWRDDSNNIVKTYKYGDVVGEFVHYGLSGTMQFYSHSKSKFTSFFDVFRGGEIWFEYAVDL